MSGGEEGEEEDGYVGDEHFECGFGDFLFYPPSVANAPGAHRLFRATTWLYLSGGKLLLNRPMNLMAGNRGSESQ